MKRRKLERETEEQNNALGIIGGLLFGGIMFYSLLLFRDAKKIEYRNDVELRCAHRFSGLNYSYHQKVGEQNGN
jgi:hypothetical protein